MELEQLKQLVAFNEYKTLSNAAKELHISQPVLSRSMQKLEEELGISLFNRSKNRIAFNETGLQALMYAQRIVNESENMKQHLIEFDRRINTFSIGTCAPAPSIFLTQKASRFFDRKIISSEITSEDLLINRLEDKTYTVIVMPYECNKDNIESFPFMKEKLFFSLPHDHPLANKKSISFKEMDGTAMLLMSDIGFWYKMHKEEMPNTKFLTQDDRNTFYELIEFSSLPSFTSDFVMKTDNTSKNRIIVPIKDKKAEATFYLWYLKENKIKLFQFIHHIKEYSLL